MSSTAAGGTGRVDRTAPFIVFEGGEGGGKTTQAALLRERLADRVGIEAIVTRQPGGTAIGARLRSILLDVDNAELSDRCEALLMAADRAQHASELIGPTLASGVGVICDRYLYSSVAYQGYGRGLDAQKVAEISEWATAALLPDLVVLIDIDLDTASARLQRELDRFEQAGADFHERVRRGFLAQANEDPSRWVVIDGSRSIDEVAEQIWDAVARLPMVTQ